MAYVVTRERKPRKGEKKPAFSYQVKWRTGGTAQGHPEAQTFRDPSEAALFKDAVERAGENWPPNYIPKLGWVSPDTYRRWTGEDVPETSDAPKLIDFAAAWVNSLSGIEGSTRHRYRRILVLHILPWFGDCLINDTHEITTQKIGAWINHLETNRPAPNTDEPRDPLKPKSIRNVHGVLSAILQEAVEAEPPLRETNPCRRSKLPKALDGEGDEEMVFLTPEEFDAIIDVMKPDAVPLATLLVGTGLRYSEATALQVRDLELMGKRPRLTIWRAWKKQEDGTWELGAPKTPKAQRKVSLSVMQVNLLLPLIAGKKRKDLVFDGPGGGRWIHQTFFTGRWRPAVYKAVRCAMHQQQDWDANIGRRGFRDLTNEHIVPCGCYGTLEKVPRVHDLRHTQVAWLIRANQPMAAIQRRLGHESIQTTIDRYGHLMDEIDDDMVVALDALMTRGREKVAAG
jgi:integrase